MTAKLSELLLRPCQIRPWQMPSFLLRLSLHPSSCFLGAAEALTKSQLSIFKTFVSLILLSLMLFTLILLPNFIEITYQTKHTAVMRINRAANIRKAGRLKFITGHLIQDVRLKIYVCSLCSLPHHIQTSKRSNKPPTLKRKVDIH